MSEKRKFNEMRDPDYPQNAKVMKTEADRSPPATREERISRICAIVKREFHRELNAREQEILDIDHKIALAKKLLLQVKYAVVSHYYHKKGMELPDSQAQECVQSLHLDSTAPPPTERDQRALHPALKSILGKKTVDFDEILKARPTREAAKTAKTSIKEKLLTKKEEKRLQRARNGSLNKVICRNEDTTLKVPRHVEPNKVEQDIQQLNSARGGNQTKHLIAVGNTSKYVGDDKFANGVTHKWLVYVKSKTPIPIEKLVNKVRFFLHPSYRPNDIVDVSEPPFHISRRGWGEFPIRLQLFFDASLQQKPVQLMHNLVLDESRTGLQTMGAETLFEIWLRTDHIQASIIQAQKEIKTTNDSQTTEDEQSQNSDDIIDHIDDKLMEFLTRIESQTSQSICEEGERIEPTISAPLKIPENNSTKIMSVIEDQETENNGMNAGRIGNLNTGILSGIYNKAKDERQFNVEMDEDSSKEESDFHGFNTDAKHNTVSLSSSLVSNYADSLGAMDTTTLAEPTERKIIFDASKSNTATTTIPSVDQTERKIYFDEASTSNTTNSLQSQHKHLNHLVTTTKSNEINIKEQGTVSVCNQSSVQTKAPQVTFNPSSASTVPRVPQSINSVGKTPNIKEPTDKKPNTQTVISQLNSVQKQPIIFQRRLVKCIDKQGNVKYVQMLVKAAPPQSGSGNALQSTAVAQKAVFITKSNGHAQEAIKKPVTIKIAPSSGTVNMENAVNATVIPNLTAQPQKQAPVLINPVKHPLPPMVQSQTQHPEFSTSKENQSNLSLTKSTQNSTNKNQVLVKNGKMYIKDPLQAKIKQQTKKQESLLKPQVSLLKPIVKNDNLNNCIRNDAKGIFNHTAIATDHDYTCLIGRSPQAPPRVAIQKSRPHQLAFNQHKSSILTVSSPNNSRINVIVTKLDDEDDASSEIFSGYRSDNLEAIDDTSDTSLRLLMRGTHVPKTTALMQKPRRDYHSELRMAFNKANIWNFRQGVEYLLQRLPLINEQAKNNDYILAFPFVVRSQQAFDSLMTPKLRANEWIRSKYILRLLQTHPLIDKTNIWTTKEITLFARHHAYTPVIKCKVGIENSGNVNSAMSNTLKDLVKKEIKREKYDIQTLTLVHETYDWINSGRQKIKEELLANEDIIDVDKDDIENDGNTSNAPENEQSPLKVTAGKLFYGLEDNVEQEAAFVSNACQQIGVRLNPEEIIPGLLHPSTHLVLAQCLKSFMNDLLRRAMAFRPHPDMTSSLIDNTIQPDDVKNAVISRPQWDFLTNNYLGVVRPKDQKQ